MSAFLRSPFIGYVIGLAIAAYFLTDPIAISTIQTVPTIGPYLALLLAISLLTILGLSWIYQRVTRTMDRNLARNLASTFAVLSGFSIGFLPPTLLILFNIRA